MCGTIMPSQEDRDCATFAREALFPHQMHRDAAHPHHFPALAALDRFRQRLLLQSTHPSSLFPRGVLLVRNLADESHLQWNGTPDIDQSNASFDVIPNVLRVRCTSECSKLTSQLKQTALVEQQEKDGETAVIVLCTDRLLQSDYKEPLDAAVAKELPSQTYQVIEEAVAHQVAKVGACRDKQQNAAALEVEAAKAAECYYSRHLYDKQTQVKRGSGLPLGFSKLPDFWQSSIRRNCLVSVATDHLLMQQAGNEQMSRREAHDAVREAMMESERK